MKELELIADKKYELLKDDYIKVGERTVYRIRALKDFGNVKKGDLGGYIAKEENLSHDRNAWVFDNAVVVGEEAAVYDDAEIHDNVRVYDRAKVYHDARVYGNTVIRWEARVSGDAQVFDNVEISGKAKVYGDATVHNCELKDSSRVYDDAIVRNATVCMNAEIFGDAKVEGRSNWSSVVVCDNAKIYDHARVDGNYTIIGGSVRVSSFCEIGGGVTVGGDVELTSVFDTFNFRNPYSGNTFTWVEPSDKIYKKDLKDFLSKRVDGSITIEQLREDEKEGSKYPNKAAKVFDLYVKMINDIRKIKNE